MENSKERSSNFELLRIFSMLIIIIHHCCIHGVERVFSPGNNEWINGSILNIFVLKFFRPAGALGVALFFILSGFFSYEKKINFTKIKKVFFTTIFYSIFFTILYFILTYLFKQNIEGVGLLTCVNMLFPIGSTTWWFISVYLLLCLITESISYLVNHFDEKRIKYVTFFFLLFFVFAGSVLNEPYVSIQKGIFYYSLGMIIKKYDIKKNINKSIIISFSLYLLGVLCYLITFYVQFKTIIIPIKIQKYLILIIQSFSDGFIIPIVSFYIFLIFKQINIKQNILVNKLASRSIAVYLIHSSPFGALALWDLFKVRYFYQTDFFILYILLISIFIYLFSYFFDLIKSRICDIFY